jgi:hypothetical protein
MFNTSCKKNDDTKPSTLAEKILGTWKVTSINRDGSELLPIFVSSATFIFKSDKTTTSKITILGSEEVSQGTYIVNENAKTMTVTDTDGEVTVIAVVIGGSNGTFTDTDVDGVVTITKATKQ